MLPAEGSQPFDDPAYMFEPWWPGTRCIARVDRGRVRLEAAELADMLAAFPELYGLAGQLSVTDAVLDGVLLVLDRRARPDRDLLLRRLAGGDVRVGRGAFIATDILRAAGRAVSRLPFGRRRALLAEVLAVTDWCTPSRGYPGEGRTLAVAAEDMGFRAISARRLDAPYRPGPAGDAWLRIPVGAAAAEPPARLPSILAVFRRLPLETDA